MTPETVFIEQSVRNHPVTEGILSRLPAVNRCIVDGRTWHRRIKNEMVDSGFAQDRTEMSEQAHEDRTASALAPRLPEKAVRFVARIYAFAVSLFIERRPDLRVTLCQDEDKMYSAVHGFSTPARCNCMVARW